MLKARVEVSGGNVGSRTHGILNQGPRMLPVQGHPICSLSHTSLTFPSCSYLSETTRTNI